MMVTHLTSARACELHAGRVPGTNTGNLTETLVGLARKASNSPTSNDTVETMTLSDGNGVNHLIGLEDGVGRHWLLEKVLGEGNLVGN